MGIQVQTTQNVIIDYEPAGLGYRLLAYIVDWVVILIWISGWAWLFEKNSSFSNFSLYNSSNIIIYIFVIFIVFPALFYDLLLEYANNGQSIGKMLFKIRVVNVDGTSPSFGSYLLRWLFRLVDFSISYYMVGLITIVATKNAQRLGDMLAGTTVVDLKVSSSNKDLKLSDLRFQDDYKVVFVDVLDRLSDKEIQTIRSIIEDKKMKDNDLFIGRLTGRIKDVTGYTFDGDDKAFLNKVVSDYYYLAIQ